MTSDEAGVHLLDGTVKLLEENERLRIEIAAVRACFAEASQDNVIASARIADLEAALASITPHTSEDARRKREALKP